MLAYQRVNLITLKGSGMAYLMVFVHCCTTDAILYVRIGCMSYITT